ncbi:MAG: hypothetical protein IPK14_02735 [Blastocatellia bacterium]|nr:hypothetical protein [Blastocatellia bacterium]MBL8193934.1 hypothetical protein [Blastocatellia bacterium]MBN8724770.1 hypothetical protein [Acidobacteriota bacterium]
MKELNNLTFAVNISYFLLIKQFINLTPTILPHPTHKAKKRDKKAKISHLPEIKRNKI